MLKKPSFVCRGGDVSLPLGKMGVFRWRWSGRRRAVCGVEAIGMGSCENDISSCPAAWSYLYRWAWSNVWCLDIQGEDED